MKDFKLYIVTGLSGAGKTAVIRCFEDMGFYCVDNMPPALLNKFIDLVDQTNGKIHKAAVVIDIRGGAFFDDLLSCLNSLQGKVDYEILFLDATTDTLVRRFTETRRQHPLNNEGSIVEAIEQERSQLEDVRGRADRIINTTHISIKQLKERLFQIYNTKGNYGLQISFISFGYKYGLPLDSDWVFDVRFLPNPFYVPELKMLTGKNKDVRDYVFSNGMAEYTVKSTTTMLQKLLPEYLREGKSNLIVAVGCTGGQHRSVAMAEALYEAFAKEGYQALVYHRDIP